MFAASVVRDDLGEKWYANVYHVELGYGGPEEGGWWYDTGEFQHGEGPFDNREEALTARGALEAEKAWSNEGLPPKHSVISRGVFEVHIETHTGRDFPVGVMHYE